jgi:hypothetical protein
MKFLLLLIFFILFAGKPYRDQNISSLAMSEKLDDIRAYLDGKQIWI